LALLRRIERDGCVAIAIVVQLERDGGAGRNVDLLGGVADALARLQNGGAGGNRVAQAGNHMGRRRRLRDRRGRGRAVGRRRPPPLPVSMQPTARPPWSRPARPAAWSAWACAAAARDTVRAGCARARSKTGPWSRSGRWAPWPAPSRSRARAPAGCCARAPRRGAPAAPP